MRLQDFITETLTETIQGVKIAQEFASRNGARVNPGSQRLLGPWYNVLWDDYNKIPGEQIEFDIIVTTRGEGEKKAELESSFHF